MRRAAYKPVLRLPDGTTSKSVRVFLKTWERLTSGVEAFTGDKCFAFEPDIAMRSTLGSGFTYSVPLHIAELMLARIEAKR